MELECGADARRPLAHTHDPVGVEPAGLADGEALSVVGDLEVDVAPLGQRLGEQSQVRRPAGSDADAAVQWRHRRHPHEHVPRQQFLELGPAGEYGAKLAGGFEQLGGLAANHLEVARLVGVRVVAVHELQDLAGGNGVGRVCEDLHDPHVADIDHYLERARVQEIANEDARLVAEHGIGRVLAATAVAAMLIGHLLFPKVPMATEFPLVLGAISIIASMIAVFFVRLGSGGYIMGALYKGMFGAAILASVVGFQLGAFALTIQVALSGMVSLPLGTFMGLMMGFHLPIAVFEGVGTALVMVAVKQPQLPAIVETEAPVGRIRPWQALGVLLLTALLSGVLSWYASGNPDGLEWSLEHTTTGVAQVSGTAVHRELGNLQERTTVFPDYEMAEDTTDGILHGVLSIPGLAGSIIVLAVSLLLGLIIRKRSAVP